MEALLFTDPDSPPRVRRERRGAGRAELVDARLGVGEKAAVPIARVVAHVGVAVGLSLIHI